MMKTPTTLTITPTKTTDDLRRGHQRRRLLLLEFLRRVGAVHRHEMSENESGNETTGHRLHHHRVVVLHQLPTFRFGSHGVDGLMP